MGEAEAAAHGSNASDVVRMPAAAAIDASTIVEVAHRVTVPPWQALVTRRPAIRKLAVADTSVLRDAVHRPCTTVAALLNCGTVRNAVRPASVPNGAAAAR